jgi:serine/threonine protein kinase
LGLSLTMTSPEVREHGSKVLWALVEMIGPGLLSRDENRYVDLGLLGQGGMGEVRRAHDPDLRRSVALKSVREDLSQNEDLNSRFKAEAQIMAQLQHPGIVPVYEIARLADGRHYFSMQEIEGETLGSVLQRLRAHSGPREWATVPSQNGGRDWSFQRMVASVERVCDAMAYAHDRQVIHRDLKPENIMLGALVRSLLSTGDWQRFWAKATTTK